jgi:hypothetical protein
LLQAAMLLVNTTITSLDVADNFVFGEDNQYG